MPAAVLLDLVRARMADAAKHFVDIAIAGHGQDKGAVGPELADIGHRRA